MGHMGTLKKKLSGAGIGLYFAIDQATWMLSEHQVIAYSIASIQCIDIHEATPPSIPKHRPALLIA
jgi:hypothetical protein